MDHESSTDCGPNRQEVQQYLVEGEKTFRDVKESIRELISNIEWSII